MPAPSRVELGEDEAHDVDVGFIVYNQTNYPRFTELLAELGVATQPATMSFSVSDPGAGLEYGSASLNALFARRTNLARPWFHRMLVDIVRFNRRARELLVAGGHPDGEAAFFDGPGHLDDLTLAEVVEAGGYSQAFVDDYLVPLGASIWSADPTTFLSFPAVAYARFMHNHGLLQLGRRPRWRTITGGSRHYVDALVDPLGSRLRLREPVLKIRRGADRRGRIELVTAGTGTELFDRVILAGHSDQALGLLSDPSRREREILGAVRYQPNLATLHTDERLLPRRHRARASWNYHAGAAACSTAARRRRPSPIG